MCVFVLIRFQQHFQIDEFSITLSIRVDRRAKCMRFKQIKIDGALGS